MEPLPWIYHVDLGVSPYPRPVLVGHVMPDSRTEDYNVLEDATVGDLQQVEDENRFSTVGLPDYEG